MTAKIYLALVSDNFVLTEEYVTYLKNENIKLLKYMPKVQVIKLQSKFYLTVNELNQVT